MACALAAALDKPALGVHHLEGHLLSPFLSADPPRFPFVALLVSGGHTQLMRVDDVGRYTLLGETIDDAAGEAFDKTAKMMGLPYPGGPALARLAAFGDAAAFDLPRPLLHSGNLDFSFSGLKTAVMTALRKLRQQRVRTGQGEPGRGDAGGDRRRAGAQVGRPRSTPAGLTAWSSPGAWAPTGTCGSGSTRGAPRSACGCTIPNWRCAPTTAR